MNKKGEFGMRAYFIAALFFGAIIIIFSIMVGSLATNYNSENVVDDDFRQRYSNFEEFSDRIDSITDTLTTAGGVNIVDIGFGIFQATFSLIQLALSSLGLIGSSTSNFIEDFNVPEQVGAILMSLFLGVVMITLAMRIVSSTSANKL